MTGSRGSSRFARASIKTRLVILFLGGEIVLLGAFALLNYRFTRAEWTESFDSVLRTSAESLSSLAEFEHNEFELELSPDVIQRFRRTMHADLYVLTDPSGNVLRASHRAAQLPAWSAAGQAHAPQDFNLAGEAYRGFVLACIADPDSRLPETERRIAIFYAKSRYELDQRLAAARTFYLGALVPVFLASVAMVFVIVGRGLAPLKRLAAQTARLNERALETRFDSADYTADLQPLIAAFNALLGSLHVAFERERQFSSDAAHELRTPVATLKSGVQAALLSPRDAAEDRQVLEDLLSEIERLEQLCETLLEIGKASAPLDEAVLNYDELVRTLELTLQSMTPLAQQAGAAITLELPAPPSTPILLRTRELNARRIIVNLLSNALNHGGRGVAVHVTVSLGSSGAQIAIADDGPGIPPELRPFLFTRLFKQDAARSRPGGAGLGLALSRNLAEQTAGSLDFSPTLPHGACFTWIITRVS